MLVEIMAASHNVLYITHNVSVEHLFHCLLWH